MAYTRSSSTAWKNRDAPLAARAAANGRTAALDVAVTCLPLLSHTGSESKLHTLSDGAKVLFTIAQILRYYRPLLFFGLVSALCVVAAILAGGPVISDWITSRYIYHVPLAILASVRAGGKVVADIYVDSLLKHWLSTKYWVRPVTKRMQPERLHRLTSAWVDLMWPIASLVRRVPRVGPQLNWRLLVPDYSREGLRGADLKRWALLDAFDMLSPAYDKPATEAAFRQWFLQAGLVDVDVRNGYNGVQGRGTVAPGVG